MVEKSLPYDFYCSKRVWLYPFLSCSLKTKYFQPTLLRLVVSVNIPGAGAPLLSINVDNSSLQDSKQ